MNEPEPETIGGAPAAGAARRADRYGAAAPRRRPWLPVAATAAVLVLGFGVAYLGFQKYGTRDVEAEQLGYTVVDDSTLSVRLKVTRDDPTRPAVCFVRAMDRDTVEVGRREILVTSSEHGTVEFTTEVRSSSRPSAGDVYGCSMHVPEYLRAE
ncbi:DUF4307 domain-containing protein [Nocardia takedensis]|uniref:DUF4307 domain-containing protein n=1 Tax=Nocardia takedensis TaxID=259390 RepID=UPI0002EAF846|nr:DUF4307 domain-containing protein [Nocardia takedensis]